MLEGAENRRSEMWRSEITRNHDAIFTAGFSSDRGGNNVIFGSHIGGARLNGELWFMTSYLES